MSAQAAARLLEIASTTSPSPQGRIYVEEVNAIFPREDGSPDEASAGIEIRRIGNRVAAGSGHNRSNSASGNVQGRPDRCLPAQQPCSS